jgi:hypothetical protein
MQLGSYQALETIGQGGMGSSSARDARTAIVAIEVLRLPRHGVGPRVRGGRADSDDEDAQPTLGRWSEAP